MRVLQPPPLSLSQALQFIPSLLQSSAFHFYKVSLSIPLLYTLQNALPRSQLIKPH